MRIGPGPVFAYEWLRTARNWRVYAIRFLFGATLLAVLGMVELANSENSQGRNLSTIQAQAEAGMAFSTGIVCTQLSLILLVAPAATAGAICLDKQRGTLAHVLVTDLSNAEVVLGKLAARMLPAVGLVMSALGIMAICTLMGGIDPMGLAGAFLVSLGAAAVAGTLALCISVWAGKTHEVLMATYLVLTAWLSFYPGWYMMSFTAGWTRPPQWLEAAHPFWLVADVRPGAVPLHRHAYFLLGCLGFSALLAALATLRVRSVVNRQMNRPVGRKEKKKARRPIDKSRLGLGTRRVSWVRRLFSPSLDRNPVLWREWHRMRPSKWSRAIWYVYTASSIGLTALCVWLVAMPGNRGGQEVAMILGNGSQVALGLLLLSVSAATALAEERVRGSLDVLMATPLSTRSILRGKWWGAYRAVPFLAILPGVLAAAGVLLYDPQSRVVAARGAVLTARAAPGLAAAFESRWLAVPLLVGLTLAYGAAITSFGLAMATWVSRLDRAVAATVAMYVFMTVGWIFLILLLFHDDNTIGPGLCSASPFMGIAYTGAMVMEPAGSQERRWQAQIAWATFWILANVSIAAVLFKVTLATFNRKLGRIPEEGLRVPATPPGAAKRELEAVLVGE